MTETFCFAPEPRTSVSIVGQPDRFPVHRIFCVGRNYHAHAAEMGVSVDKAATQPFYFNKHPSAVLASGSLMNYPPQTSDLHHEMELVVALGGDGFEVSVTEASDLIFGYAAGLDMTRRDLQQRAKDRSHPWDLGKDFEQAAILGAICEKAEVEPLTGGAITLCVNGETRQSSDLSLMIWNVAELISDLSRYYRLRPGDVLFTGTPEGVGPVKTGDQLSGSIEGVGIVEVTIGSDAGR